jgi:predicted dehydrogenase
VYAELDDGPFHMQEPHLWKSASDATFAFKEEFEVGVTIEHASHYLTWFAAFFGPAKTITSFATCQWPDKQLGPDVPLYVTVPDFSVACIAFESGVVVRLTCSLLGPHNHVMKIMGEAGILTVNECWNYASPVYLDKYSKNRFRAERYPITKQFPFIKNWMGPHQEYPPVKKSSWKKQQARFRQDYARGVAELARAITEKRPPRLPADYCLHVTELACAINDAGKEPYQVTTTFKPLQPMDDAALKQIPSSW